MSNKIRVIGGQMIRPIYDIFSWDGGMDKNAYESVRDFWWLGGK